MYASPAKRPLTRPDLRDTLSTRERDRYQNNSPLRGERARRRRAGEGSFRSPSDFDGTLIATPAPALTEQWPVLYSSCSGLGGSDACQVGLGFFHSGIACAVPTLPATFHHL